MVFENFCRQSSRMFSGEILRIFWKAYGERGGVRWRREVVWCLIMVFRASSFFFFHLSLNLW